MKTTRFLNGALRISTSMAATAMTLLMAAQAQAQEQPQGQPQGQGETAAESPRGIDEIVVTARKRAERLSEVPVSVSAVTGEGLANLGITKTSEAVQLVPAAKIVIQDLGTSAYLRGVGSGSFNPGFEQTVGLFVDGAYYSRAAWARAGQLDIERVEVLKGPQGVLFGKNTVAGAINITSKKPTDEFEAYVRAAYEFEASDQASIEGAISGPLNADHTLKARLAMRYSDESKGYIKNNAPGGPDGPINDQFLTRGTLTWEPSSNFDSTLSVTYVKSDTKGSSAEVFRCEPRAPAAGDPPSLNTALAVGASHEDCKANFRNSSINLDPASAAVVSAITGEQIDPVDNGDRFRGLALTNTANWHAGDLTLTSVTSYIRHNQRNYSETDNTDVPFTTLRRYERFNTFMQELRLASPRENKLSWVAGAYFERSNLEFIEDDSAYIFPYPGFPAPAPGTVVPPSGTWYKRSDQNGRSIALFGEATFAFTPTLELSAGLRYTNERKDIDHRVCVGPLNHPTCGITSDDTPAIVPLIAEDLHYRAKLKKNNLSPAVTLRWRPNRDVMAYASFKQGFKAGGFDMEMRNLPAQLTAGPPTRVDSNGDGIPDAFVFKNESVNAYEVGTKLTFPAANLQVNIALFQNDFKNLQVSQFDGIVGFNIVNAGKSRSRGIEVDARWRPIDRLTLGGSLSLLDSKFLDFPGAQCPSDATAGEVSGVTPTGSPACNLKGRRTAFAPKAAFTLTADYTVPLTGPWELALSGAAQHSSKYFMENTGEPENMQQAYWKLDARVALQTSRWSIALVGRNLTNTLTYSHATSVPQAGPGYFFGFVEKPRTLAVEVGAKF